MRGTISMKLFNTLVRGKKRLGKESLSRISGFVESQRLSNESFADKSGSPDIYYTAFGWMLSYVLGLQTNPEKAAALLERQNHQEMNLVHYAAYIRCRMMLNLFSGGKLKLLLSLAAKPPIRQSESFEEVPHNDLNAPYTQFIRLSLSEDSGHTVRDKAGIINSLNDYRIAGGGFANSRDSIHATTNATAAALSVAGQLKGYSDNEDINYLWCNQHNSGGYNATENSPLPDLLSTATASFIIQCYNKKTKVSPVDFIEAHWLDSGGFSATLAENTSDVEYTFYGLLALGTI